MQKLILTFSLSGLCPLSTNYVNALISAGVPYKLNYKGASMCIIVKPKYAYLALLANYNLAGIPLPAPIVNNNSIVFGIS
jgi:hypothetical protein